MQSLPYVSILGAFVLSASALVSAAPPAAPAPAPLIQAVPFNEVKVHDEFWSPRLEINRTVTIPYAFKMCEQTGRIENFDVAAHHKPGGMKGYFFNDSDVYKVIEAAAYSLTNHPDPALERYCDELIERIAAAQEHDGYLYCSRTILDPKNMPPGGKARWSDMAGGHELYCAGHLYEAACAYFQATKKPALLNVARKNADLVATVFGPGRDPRPCGHPEVEIGLVKLYRTTGDAKYLNLARFFIDTRGRAVGRKLYGDYCQDHKPLLSQTSAVGHSVRAGYVFTGMADVAALTGEKPYIDAITRLWDDVVDTKLYLTGGMGARANIEGFGDPYELPNKSAYAETCAAIANALWNERLFLATGDARYVDVLERVIYNGFLAGVSLKGDRFFYPNPLESRNGAERSPWFDCACCPSNVVRFLPSIPGYIYAQRERDVYVNLYIGSETTLRVGGRRLGLKQETLYPWGGRVEISVDPDRPLKAALHLRIPGWARGEATPGGLYRFLDPWFDPPTLWINGRETKAVVQNGYLVIERNWRPGDQVGIELSMPVRHVAADSRVKDDVGRIALQRGPLVYCFEGIDQAEPHIASLVLDSHTPFLAEHHPDLLGGVTTLVGEAREAERTRDGQVRLEEARRAVAIPYYAWANRAKSPMSVWLAADPATASPRPLPTLASRAKIVTSAHGDVDAICDQIEHSTSGDNGDPRLHWWPHKGTQEWVEYHFDKPVWVSGVELFWFDDTGVGECRVPKSWTLRARVDGRWVAVDEPSDYGVALNRYNRCTFEPLETDALRLEIQSQEKWAGGIYEWRVIEADERAIREARQRRHDGNRHEAEEKRKDERREDQERRDRHDDHDERDEHKKPHDEHRP